MKIERAPAHMTGEAWSDYDFEKRYALRRERLEAERRQGETPDPAPDPVEEARASNTRATLEMMDRHTDMVKKSQEFYKIKERKLAIERRARERREEQTALIMEASLRKAEREKTGPAEALP